MSLDSLKIFYYIDKIPVQVDLGTFHLKFKIGELENLRAYAEDYMEVRNISIGRYVWFAILFDCNLEIKDVNVLTTGLFEDDDLRVSPQKHEAIKDMLYSTQGKWIKIDGYVPKTEYYLYFTRIRFWH